MTLCFGRANHYKKDPDAGKIEACGGHVKRIEIVLDGIIDSNEYEGGTGQRAK